MISVCMATWNGEKYIKKQIESILLQLNSDDELIISDDGSSDKTLSIIASIHDKRIKVFHHKSNKLLLIGSVVAKNFENALKHASGDYIFMCDQDDVWMPNKVNSCLSVLQENDLVLHDGVVTDDSLSILEDSLFRVHNARLGFLRNLFKNSFVGCCMVFRKNMLNKILPFPPNLYAHDIWICLIAILWGRVALLREKLIFYRRHGNNASSTTTKSQNGLFVKVKMRVDLVFWLITRSFALFTKRLRKCNLVTE